MAPLHLLFYVVGSLLLLVFLTWLLVTVYIYLLHRRYAHIPSPKMPSFYLGHTPAMLAKMQKDGRFGELILQWSEECGRSPLYVIFWVNRPAIVCLRKEDLKEVFMNTSKVEKSKFLYDVLAEPLGERYMGQSLETTRDQQLWKIRRKLYDPSFTKNSLHGLLPVFVECADKVVDRLRTLADGKTQVLMKEEFVAFGLDVITKVMFSSESVGTVTNDKKLGDGTFHSLLKHAANAQGVALRFPFFKYLHPFEAEGYREAIRSLRKIGRDLIKKRIMAVENRESVPNDVLTQILRVTNIEKNVEVEDLVDDFVAFYVGGYDTSSNLMSFTLVLLIQHPDVMQRVCDELYEVLGEKKTLSTEDVAQMKYLEKVFQEALRLYPPVAQTQRDASDTITLSGYEIPKGTTLVANIYANHHNPEYWEDPEKFDPDRFDAGRPKASVLNYHPFSAGRHNCIGKMFVMIAAKTMMSRLLTNFKFHLPDGYQLRVEAKAFLSPAGGVPCTVEPLFQ